ncbi:ABC transporter ATP-binding protein [Rhizobium sp. RAF56]|uniref:ABC transporter ATP-binding protein n=1 Tax=Rhizobium sp. RAF56 TaxID=3233062 RepID=UPI003F9C124B
MKTPSDTVIKFENVDKYYGGIKAVDGISFSAAAGETVAVLGPSGCGKTTTLRMIAGFEEPDRGTIEIGNESMIGKRPYERNVGLLFQHYALFPHMSVRDNVAYGLKHRGWPKATIGARVDEMLSLVQLEGFADRRPRQMSGGQQQRVALARVLATKPKLVLLDEPLSALDAKLREELGADLKRILTSVGSTTIVVTHDQDEAMSLSDRIIVMNRGRIDQIGSPSEIYQRPATQFVADFIGRSNWLGGIAKIDSGRDGANVILDCGTVLTTTASGIRDAAQVSVGIRPERIKLMPEHDKGSQPEANQFFGKITSVLHMGAEIHYQVSCAVGNLMVVRPSDGAIPFSNDDRVGLSFSGRDCAVFPVT